MSTDAKYRFNNGYFLEKKKRSLRECLSQVADLLFYSKEDAAVTEALAEVLAFFDVERAYLGIIHTEASHISFAYEAVLEGVGGVKSFFDKYFSSHLNLTAEQLPWWFSRLKSEQDIVVNNLDDISEEALGCLDLLAANKVCSLLCVPTRLMGTSNGFLCIETTSTSKQWTNEDIDNLHILASCFSYFVERERLREKINLSAMKAMQNEILLQMVIENIPVGIELYDKDGYLVDINPTGLNILETTSEKVLGVNLFENPTISDESKMLIRKGERAYFENQYDFQLVKSTYFQSEAQVDFKSLVGENVPLKDVEGSIFGYLQLVYDNTEDFKRNEEMKSMLTKLKLAVDTGKSFIWEYNVKEDTVAIDYSLSDRQKVWGRNVDSMKSPGASFKNHLELIHPDDVERVYDQGFRMLIKGKISEFRATYRQWINNDYYWLTTNFHVYKYNSDGQPSHIICYSINVTDQQELELDLLRAKEVDKIKSSFIENMSHEIRTPLNAIVGLSCFLAETYESEETRELTNCIQLNNEQLLRTVDEMLYYTQLERGNVEYQLEEVDVKPICQRVIEKYLPKTSAEVTLSFDESHPSVFLYTDAEKLEQLLSQLVDNAVKYTREGSIVLTYETISNHTLRFVLADTGIGMSEKEQERLFYPFYKAENFHQGVGLGLSISKWITEALGGKIRVKSFPGRGSVFHVDLPLK